MSCFVGCIKLFPFLKKKKNLNSSYLVLDSTIIDKFDVVSKKSFFPSQPLELDAVQDYCDNI